MGFTIKMKQRQHAECTCSDCERHLHFLSKVLIIASITSPPPSLLSPQPFFSARLISMSNAAETSSVCQFLSFSLSLPRPFGNRKLHQWASNTTKFEKKSPAAAGELSLSSPTAFTLPKPIYPFLMLVHLLSSTKKEIVHSGLPKERGVCCYGDRAYFLQNGVKNLHICHL